MYNVPFVELEDTRKSGLHQGRYLKFCKSNFEKKGNKKTTYKRSKEGIGSSIPNHAMCLALVYHRSSPFLQIISQLDGTMTTKVQHVTKVLKHFKHTILIVGEI